MQKKVLKNGLNKDESKYFANKYNLKLTLSQKSNKLEKSRKYK